MMTLRRCRQKFGGICPKYKPERKETPSPYASNRRHRCNRPFDHQYLTLASFLKKGSKLTDTELARLTAKVEEARQHKCRFCGLKSN